MILARLVAPTETGLFSVAASIVLLAQAIRDFGVGEFLVQEENLTPHKVRTAFGLTLVIAWTLGTVTFLLRTWIAEIYKTPELGNLIAVVCGSFFVAPFSSTVLAILNREMAFGALMRISLASSLMNAIVSTGLAYRGWGSMALACGMLSANITTAVAAALSARTWDHFVPSLREWRALASFGVYISGASIVNQFGGRLPDLIIGRLLGYQALGLFNRSNGIIGIVHEMVLSGIQTVAFPAFAAAHRDGENVRQAYLRMATLVTGAAFPILALVSIVAEPLVWCLLGPTWRDAVPFIPPLALCYGITLVAPMVTPYLSATGWVKIVPRIAIGLQVSSLTITSVTAQFSIMWVVAGCVVANLLNLLINAHYLRKATGIGLFELFRAATKSALSAVVSAASAYGASQIPALSGHPFLMLMVCSATGCVGWFIGAAAVRHPIIKEVNILLSEVRHSLHRLA